MKKYIFLSLIMETALLTIGTGWAMDDKNLSNEKDKLVEMQQVTQPNQSVLEFTNRSDSDFDKISWLTDDDRKLLEQSTDPNYSLTKEDKEKAKNLEERIKAMWFNQLKTDSREVIFDPLLPIDLPDPKLGKVKKSSINAKTSKPENILEGCLFDDKIVQQKLQNQIANLTIKTDIMNALIKVCGDVCSLTCYGSYVEFALDEVISWLSEESKQVLLQKYKVRLEAKPKRPKWCIISKKDCQFRTYQSEKDNKVREEYLENQAPSTSNNHEKLHEKLNSSYVLINLTPPSLTFIESYSKQDFLRKHQGSSKPPVVKTYLLERQQKKIDTLKRELQNINLDYVKTFQSYQTALENYKTSKANRSKSYTRVDLKQFSDIYKYGIARQEKKVEWNFDQFNLNNHPGNFSPLFITSLTIRSTKPVHDDLWEVMHTQLGKMKNLTHLSINLPTDISDQKLESFLKLNPNLPSLELLNASEKLVEVLLKKHIFKKQEESLIKGLKELTICAPTLNNEAAERYIDKISRLMESPNLSLTTLNLSGDKNFSLHGSKLISALLNLSNPSFTLDLSNTGIKPESLGGFSDIMGRPTFSKDTDLVLNLKGNGLEKDENSVGFIKIFSKIFPHGRIEVEFINDYKAFLDENFVYDPLGYDLCTQSILDDPKM
jgi:hypothetical protein